MPRTLPALLTAILCAAIVAGCGDGSSSDTSSTATTVPRGPLGSTSAGPVTLSVTVVNNTRGRAHVEGAPADAGTAWSPRSGMLPPGGGFASFAIATAVGAENVLTMSGSASVTFTISVSCPEGLCSARVRDANPARLPLIVANHPGERTATVRIVVGA